MEKIKSFAKKHPVWTGVIGVFILFILIGIFSDGDNSSTTNTKPNQNTNIKQNLQDAINIVSPKLTGLPDLDINSDDLQAIKNSVGEGVFVYVQKTDFYSVERFFLWMVIDDNAYAINGATKDLTPTLNFPRDADERVWKKTGLDKYDASEAVGIVFNNKEEEKSSSISDFNAIEMMEIAFIGDYSQGEIKTLLDATMQLNSLPITEENYQRLGSVLVTLRKEYGVSEMEILNCMKFADYRNSVGGNITPEDAVIESASICAVMLSS